MNNWRIFEAIHLIEAGYLENLRKRGASEGKLVGKVPTKHFAAEGAFAIGHMDDPAPAGTQDAMHLVDETDQFIFCEVLDDVEGHHCIPLLGACLCKGLKDVTLRHALDAEPVSRLDLLWRTIDPPNIGVSEQA